MNLFSKRFNKVLTLILSCVFIVGLVGCGGNENKTEKETLVFADPGWDSVKVHNSIAQTIIEEGFGYPTEVKPGSTPITFTGLRNGDIDIYMELWTDNLIEDYNEALDKKEIIELSTNFDDNTQGLFVPTYVIEGDKERGIEPMAPNLKTIQDLKKYPELFKDEEDPDKGRIYGAPTGWAVDEILQAKVKNYGLNETFNYFSPGSGTSLAASLAAAIEKGEPWVGYYWTPTWVSGKYDITLLEDKEYSDELWNNEYACEFKPCDVTVVVNKDLSNKAEDVVKFLRNYKTSSKLTSEVLAYMQNNEASVEEAAIWFLKKKEDVWGSWVTDEVKQKVKAAIK
ncbi:MAG: ABC transporter substrate-binding protein [Firmicutes bacterium]|nr:ABC transporter substrate-binding protein [Bacillota bacterium]